MIRGLSGLEKGSAPDDAAGEPANKPAIGAYRRKAS